MDLIEILEDIEETTSEAFESGACDYDACVKVLNAFYTVDSIPSKLIAKTPLADFEKNIKNAMIKSGFEYKLDLVGVVATCDGSCIEFFYHLSWYDGGIETATFHFETEY